MKTKYTNAEHTIITQCLKENPLNKAQAFVQAAETINRKLGKNRTAAGITALCYQSEKWKQYEKQNPAFILDTDKPNIKNTLSKPADKKVNTIDITDY